MKGNDSLAGILRMKSSDILAAVAKHRENLQNLFLCAGMLDCRHSQTAVSKLQSNLH